MNKLYFSSDYCKMKDIMKNCQSQKLQKYFIILSLIIYAQTKHQKTIRKIRNIYNFPAKWKTVKL